MLAVGHLNPYKDVFGQPGTEVEDMGSVSRRRFLKITGAAVGTAAAGSAGFQAACSRESSATGPRGTGITKVPYILRHLLLEMRRDCIRPRRPALED